MAYKHLLQSQLQHTTSHSESNAIKTSLIAGLAMGLVSAAGLYLYRIYGGASSDEMSGKDRRALLKRELLNELKKYPIQPPKDQNYMMTRDFMIDLFRLLFTYQTIGREIMKEEILDRRIQHLRTGDHDKWEAVMDSRPKEFQGV